MKQLYLFILFMISMQISAQDKRVMISGEIKSDSIAIENVHVINLNSKKGTVSDNYGVFKLKVQENDTLLFSDIQFENKMILIQKHHLEKKYIKVNFQIDINELDEVVIIKSANMSQALGLPNADRVPLTQTERKVNFYKNAGAISKLYGLISGEQKQRKKIQKLERADEELRSYQKEILKIRNYFKDDFFIKTLKIPEESINNFITSCLNIGIVDLYKKEKYLEIIDVFLAKSKTFEK